MAFIGIGLAVLFLTLIVIKVVKDEHNRKLFILLYVISSALAVLGLLILDVGSELLFVISTMLIYVSGGLFIGNTICVLFKNQNARMTISAILIGVFLFAFGLGLSVLSGGIEGWDEGFIFFFGVYGGGSAAVGLIITIVLFKVIHKK